MRQLVYISVGVMLAVTSLAAEDAGTESPFTFGAGARELALGGAAMAVTSGTTAPFWNPAGLNRAERFSLSGLHVRLYDSDVAYDYVGLVWPTLDFGTFGAGVFRLGVDGIEKRDANNFRLGETDESRLAFYLAYGRIVSGYQVGLALTLEHHSLDGYSSSSSPGLNLAVGRRFELGSARFHSFSVAAVARNLIRPGTRFLETTTKYPIAVEFGASLEIIPGSKLHQSAVASLKVVKTDGVKPELSLGLEYTFGPYLRARGGLRGGQPSAGGGLSYKGLTFDYALVDRELGSLHLFTLSSSFGNEVSKKRSRRELQRESEFNSLMNDRLLAGKREMAGNLLTQGRESKAAGDLVKAVDFFNRALFMARSIGMDTLAFAREYRDGRHQLDEVERKHRFRENLDSAQARFAAGDYLATQYFANLALNDEPTATVAGRLLADATSRLEATSSRTERVAAQLALADSLLSSGRHDRAGSILRALLDSEPNNDLIRLMLKRAEFERCKDRASSRYANGDPAAALLAVDSAQNLFPGHQWCADMRRRIEASLAALHAPQPEAASIPAPQKLSRDLRNEVEKTYKTAMSLFKAGKLAEAIAQWERVERLAPGYKSVRSYLVSGYKYVGVEEYGKGNLQQAVRIWEKALGLEPGNEEIVSYLKRTRTEITKLREFSYDGQ